LARLYIDANLGREVVRLLNRAGHETTYAIDLGYPDERDRFHLKQASAGAMALVTLNRNDFRFLHRLWSSLFDWEVLPVNHAGIVTASREPDPAVWVAAIDELIRGGIDLPGQLFTWEVETGIWYRDKF